MVEPEVPMRWCQLEDALFPDAEFAGAGRTLHVVAAANALTSSTGHTIDGYPVAFEARRAAASDSWALEGAPPGTDATPVPTPPSLNAVIMPQPGVSYFMAEQQPQHVTDAPVVSSTPSAGSAPPIETPPKNTPASLQNDNEQERRKAVNAADIDSQSTLEKALYDYSAKGIDRARAGGTMILTAATTIATLYGVGTGLLFSVSGPSLPLRGLLAPIFLSLAVVLATGNAAFIPSRSPKRRVGLRIGGTYTMRAVARWDYFARFVRANVAHRSWMLRAAVLALALGLVAIALPFAKYPTEMQAATSVTWPTAPVTGFPKDQAAILFKAQVDQAAKGSSSAMTVQQQGKGIDSDRFFWLSLTFGGAAVLLLAGLSFGLSGEKSDEDEVVTDVSNGG